MTAQNQNTGPVIEATAWPKVKGTTLEETYRMAKAMNPNLPPTFEEWVEQCKANGTYDGGPLGFGLPPTDEIEIEIPPHWYGRPDFDLLVKAEKVLKKSKMMREIMRKDHEKFKASPAGIQRAQEARQQYLKDTFWKWFNGTLMVIGFFVIVALAILNAGGKKDDHK